jgi:hypothetical protein
MANIRFLYANLLDAAAASVVASSQAAAQITSAQKTGSGSGTLTPGGTFAGTTELTYVVVIDGAGDVGAATVQWSDDGGATWDATGVVTDTSPVALSHGITVTFAGGAGTDFSAGDRWDFKVLFGYGPARALDRNRNTEWRSAAVASPVTLTLDLGSALAVQALVLMDHNLTAAATITLAANSSNAWGAPAYGPVTVTWAAGKLAHFLAAAETYRYWQLSITDTANPDGYLRLAELFLGPFTELTQNFDRGWKRGVEPYLDGDLAALHPTTVVLGLPQILEVDFRTIPEADRATLLDTIYPALYPTTTRRARPCVICPNPATPNDVLLAYWEGAGIATTPFLAHWELSVRFREHVRSLA